MTTQAQAMVLASFAADSLSLAAHWIYDTNVIDHEFGLIDQLLPPAADSYHASRHKGDFTHYGDQTLVLLQHLAENGEFDLTRFAESWRTFCTTSTGYRDRATQKTLAAMAEGKAPDSCGSGSSDLGGPARLAPLIYWYRDQPEQLLAHAFEQTRLTHTGSGIEVTTEFIIRVVLAVLDGIPPVTAIEDEIDRGVQDLDLDMRLRRCLDTADDDSRRIISEFGQMCSTSAALPGAIHLVLAHPHSLREALIENVMAGGDSAARGLVVGMILGAHLGIEEIESDWLAEMTATRHIRQCLAKRA
jgi:ADP-ribosylglycohydrolase